MSVTIDSTPRPQNDITGLAVTLATASLGGTIGVSVIIDDAVITSRTDALLAIEAIKNEVNRRNWPIA